MSSETMTPRERFLAALHRQPTDRPAVGNCVSAATVELMDASGCPFPEAHLDPEVMAGLAATSYEILGYDTIAPVFSVQHEAAALGCEVDWGRKDMMPDATTHPCRTAEDLRVPEDLLDHPALQVVLEALGLLRERYGDQVAIIGKVFGPWTLAYHLFGVQQFLMLTLDDPAEVRRILEALRPVPQIFAEAQREAGADVVTLADHATGDLVSARMYEEFLWPLHCRLAREVSMPLILHICGNTADRLPAIARSGLTCFHFESRVPPEDAVALAAGGITLMGNVNNPELLLRGRPQDVRASVQRILQAGVDIVAPECAVPLTTPTANLQAITQAAIEYQPA
jgi:[methyl-Co(III) methanol-specific corrinoid protein]:coenzyme M methyltransferase